MHLSLPPPDEGDERSHEDDEERNVEQQYGKPAPEGTAQDGPGAHEGNGRPAATEPPGVIDVGADVLSPLQLFDKGCSSQQHDNGQYEEPSPLCQLCVFHLIIKKRQMPDLIFSW